MLLLAAPFLLPMREVAMEFRYSNISRGTKPQRTATLLFAVIVTLVVSLLLVSCGGSSTTSSSSSAAGVQLGLSATSTAVAVPTVQVDTPSSPAQDVLSAVYSSVVNIDVKATVGGQAAEGVGSGVVYTADGLILTNDHVVTLDGNVQTGQQMTVTFSDGSTAPATLVATDATKDVAAIKVANTGLTPVTFAATTSIKLAEWAIVIGSPLDFRNSVTLGIVSGLDRTLDTGTGTPLTGLMQIDSPISPGNSGGGCFDTAGHFIGMPEVYLPPGQTGAENIGFAIPADVVAATAKTLTGK